MNRRTDGQREKNDEGEMGGEEGGRMNGYRNA